MYNRPQWYASNRAYTLLSGLDLCDFFGLEAGKLDLLSGGAPCQSFSYAGKRLGLEDARGTLFYHYSLFLQQLSPACSSPVLSLHTPRGALPARCGQYSESKRILLDFIPPGVTVATWPPGLAKGYMKATGTWREDVAASSAT